MATKRQRRRRRRLILLAIVLAFIFIPERTVDEVTEAPVNLVEEALQEAPVSSEIVSEYEKAKKEQDSLAGTAANTGSTSTKQKAQKSSSSPSQQYAGSSENKYYTKDRNGLYDFAGFVLDAANLLTTAQYNELTAFLNNLDDTTGVQIAVLTVPSLNGVALEEFSIRHAEKWQLGQKGVDNGALLVASMEEHALRIETGYGTEGALTDAKCSRIIRNILVPQFRDGKYGEGIIEAVKNMAGIITEDESLVSKSVLSESSSSSSSSEDDYDTFYIILGAIIILIILGGILSNIGSGGGSSYSGGSYHSSGHSYSGGGHSYSGGGGHFGGGGSSGHW